MSLIAKTPKPPYYAVMFTSQLTADDNGYADMAAKMLALAAKQAGFLGFESAREDLGISVSYWTDLESISQWKANMEHQEAQQLGRQKWYSAYKVRVSKVERDYALG
ncbi:MAG: heme-degrading monooxygenase HmoA [Kiritimatiellia bacterium]|jgi:heme-degrading monooxygenase HmoA